MCINVLYFWNEWCDGNCESICVNGESLVGRVDECVHNEW